MQVSTVQYFTAKMVHQNILEQDTPKLQLMVNLSLHITFSHWIIYSLNRMEKT